MYGFYGKLLRINVTEGKVKEEPLPDDVLKKYLGGKALGAYLLLKHAPAKVDPLSAENPLIFTTGPVADTALPAASRYGVFTKAPQTGFFSESYSGGFTAPAMKRTGYDAFVLEGAADKPVFLHISDEGVSFKDASHLWGKDTYATEDALLEEVGVDGAQAIAIGPAGENLVSFACIENNYWRSAGRTGVGAVMGSKNIKGIVFSGSQKAPLADEDLMKQYSKDLVKNYKDSAGAKNYREKGTPMMVAVLNNAHSFPTRYWSQGSYDKWSQIGADAMQEQMEVKPKACYRCFIACGKLSKVTGGRHAGLEVEGPEYETIYSFGGLCLIDDINEILYLNDLCDRLGLDTITAGNAVAFGIEAGKRNKLEGMPDYGDVDGIAKVVEQIARKEGPGAILAGGVKRAAEALGLEDLAIHVKGLEPAGYDPRALPGMGLAYAVSDRGACHLRSTFYKAELAGIVPKEQVDGKAEVYLDFEHRCALHDCLIICRFYRDIIGWEGLGTVIKASTGLEMDKGQLEALACRATTLARLFNIREGWTKDDDSLPPRMFNEPIGPDNDLIMKKEDLETMLMEYYQLQGWSKDGIPLSDE